MTVTFCTSGAVKLKAGADRPTDDTVLTNADYETFINEAESYINNQCKIEGVDLVDDYASMGANVKKIIEDCASSYAAIKVINYDLRRYGRLAFAQTMLDVNQNTVSECINLLKDKKVTDYLRSNP